MVSRRSLFVLQPFKAPGSWTAIAQSDDSGRGRPGD